MKKILYFASMMLTVFMTYSCTMFDNPVDDPGTFIIVDDNNNKYETELVATFTGEVGKEVTLTLGVYDGYDIYGVDFGDGKIVVDTVGYQAGGARERDYEGEGIPSELPGTLHTGSTKFTGTVVGDGTIKVYGNSDVWYLIADGGAMPTSFDQKKLKNVVQMTINGANVESVTLPATEVLKIFNFNNSPVKTVDISQAPNLTSLRIENLKTSLYPNNFTGIDVSNNTLLEYLYLGVAASDKEGNIASVDLSKNTAIQNVYISGVHLTNITLPENAAINTLNLSENDLTSIDVSKAGKIKSLNVSGNKLESLSLAGLTDNCIGTLQANNNQLTTIDFGTALAEKVTLTINDNLLTELNVPVVTNNLNAQNNKLKKFSYKGVSSKTRYLRLQDNELTFATLPLKPELHEKAQYYVYAPQADMEVAPEGAVLDLSEQASAQGVLDAPVATTFTVKAGETTLTAGADYTIDNGKITFLKSATGVVVEMTTEAFPLLTLKTKPFDVTAGGAGEANIWKANFTENVPAGTTLADNDFVKLATVYESKVGANAKTIAGIDFTGYMQLRVAADPKGEDLTGTEQSGSSPIIVTAKKDVTIKVYNRRQKGSNGYDAGDNKGLLCWDQAATAKIDGTEAFDQYEKDGEGNINESYGYVVTSFKLSAGKTYTLYRRGSTMQVFGIAFE